MKLQVIFHYTFWNPYSNSFIGQKLHFIIKSYIFDGFEK